MDGQVCPAISWAVLPAWIIKLAKLWAWRGMYAEYRNRCDPTTLDSSDNKSVLSNGPSKQQIKTDSLPKTCRPSRLWILYPPRNSYPSPSIKETTQIRWCKIKEAESAFMHIAMLPDILGKLAPYDLPLHPRNLRNESVYLPITFLFIFWDFAHISSSLNSMSLSQEQVLILL